MKDPQGPNWNWNSNWMYFAIQSTYLITYILQIVNAPAAEYLDMISHNIQTTGRWSE